MKKTIGVVFGGRSVEHEISILSCMQVLKAIDYEKYDVIPIYLDKNNSFYVGPDFDKLETFQKSKFKKYEVLLKSSENNQIKLIGLKPLLPRKYRKPIDCILAVVHGAGVEDGTLAGVFNLLGVPYTASDILPASISQDKIIMKKLLACENIPIIPYEYFNKDEWINQRRECLNKIEKLGYPVIIKPARLGSSIGISKASSPNELINSLSLAFEFDKRVVIEKALTNYREFNCAIFSSQSLEIISDIEEVVTSSDFLTYEDKYAKKEHNLPLRIIPAEINEQLVDEIKTLTSKINRLILNKGVSRIDFLYCLDDKKLYVNEINTIPGSLAFYLFDDFKLDFKNLITTLIEHAIKDKLLENVRTSFETNILNISQILKK